MIHYVQGSNPDFSTAERLCYHCYQPPPVYQNYLVRFIQLSSSVRNCGRLQNWNPNPLIARDGEQTVRWPSVVFQAAIKWPQLETTSIQRGCDFQVTWSSTMRATGYRSHFIAHRVDPNFLTGISRNFMFLKNVHSLVHFLQSMSYKY